MKYVMVNDNPVRVDDKPTGKDIKAAAIRDRAVDTYGPLPAYAFQFQLLGHNCNGSNIVIGDDDPPWHCDFTMVEITDNA